MRSFLLLFLFCNYGFFASVRSNSTVVPSTTSNNSTVPPTVSNISTSQSQEGSANSSTTFPIASNTTTVSNISQQQNTTAPISTPRPNATPSNTSRTSVQPQGESQESGGQAKNNTGAGEEIGIPSQRFHSLEMKLITCNCSQCCKLNTQNMFAIDMHGGDGKLFVHEAYLIRQTNQSYSVECTSCDDYPGNIPREGDCLVNAPGYYFVGRGDDRAPRQDDTPLCNYTVVFNGYSPEVRFNYTALIDDITKQISDEHPLLRHARDWLSFIPVKHVNTVNVVIGIILLSFILFSLILCICQRNSEHKGKYDKLY
ncbi:putative TM Protein [Veiled chameleon serpentovirus B]|uniref:TM Protein n=1 Tax=Veiled chameleon serpentovirus B TaxID=2806430 RepID=A0AAE7PP39_9NIDO|nr:putative TM Protein [Veiled chameleon serpentovirus B]QRC47044.1 putative TM Protein [Veiled chameleon serpentovirus B]